MALIGVIKYVFDKSATQTKVAKTIMIYLVVVIEALAGIILIFHNLIMDGSNIVYIILALFNMIQSILLLRGLYKGSINYERYNII